MGRKWTPAQESAMTLGGKTLLVSAAAGSGKTSVLTERIIRSLTHPEKPADISRMLVVTFTRAAAAELKSRIAQALTRAMASDPGNKHLSRQLFLLGGAQISTIDSFFQKAVRANFEQLGLPASFRLADGAELLPVKTELLDALIEESYHAYASSEAEGSPFARLEKNRFAQAMDHLISNRSDGKLNALLLDFAECYAADPRGVKLLKECANTLTADAATPYLQTACGTLVKNYLQALFTEALAFLEKTEAALSASPDMYVKCDAILTSDLLFCRAMLTALGEVSYTRVREVAFSFLSGRFPTIKEKTTAVIEYQEWRNKFKSDVQKRVQPLLKPEQTEIQRQTQLTANLLEVLYRFYTEYETRLFSEKKERGVFEYNDMRAMLYQLLTDKDGTPSPFATQLAAQYDTVYIDEYQDVDFLQDRIFSIIGGNRRFMVGDIKQSIYGFRGSEPSIFAGYRRTMPFHDQPGNENADGVCVFMSENFRCDEPVIRFANQICSFLFSACEETIGYQPQDDLVCGKRHDAPLAPAHPAPVQFTVFDPPPRKSAGDEESEGEENSKTREEAIWVAAEISRLLRTETLDDGTPIAPNDIAILVRNRAHGKLYSEELERLNVPVSSSTSTDLSHAPLLIDLLNLLRAIDNPYRDLPLSEALLSPFFSFSLEELSEVREASDRSASLFDACEEFREKETSLATKVAEALTFLQTQRESAAILPADRFLRLLYAEERLSPYTGNAVLLFLYEQARVYQRTSFCGLYGFLGHITKLLEGDKLSPGGFEAPENAVTVMTVHHSKGLEFPVVFLCSTGAAFNKDDIKKPLLYHRLAGCGAKLYNAETGESEDTALREAIKLQIDAEASEESIRTLYVALTRARERLYVTGTVSGKWETTVANASQIKRGSRTSILGVNNTLIWMLAAMQEDAAKDSSFPCEFHHLPYGTVERGVAIETRPVSKDEETASAISPATLQFARVLKEEKNFVYPLEHLRALPTKVAASNLSPDLLDRITDQADSAESLETQIRLMSAATPAFDLLLQSDSNPTAAERGTATHAFLQFCSFQALSEHTVQAESARLVEEGFLTQQSVDIMHIHQLELFCQSELLQWILRAKRVRREQTFGLFLPMSDLTQDPTLAKRLEKEKVFVQGSIDLLLEMPEGERILIDYKTDHVRPEEQNDFARFAARMQAEHAHQLTCYSQAVTQLFGAPPARVCIYSLPLGKTIEIRVSKNA